MRALSLARRRDGRALLNEHADRRNIMLPRLLVSLALASPCCAQVVFSDTFDSGPSPLWRNERGAWAASGGLYYATQPTNSPPTLSTLPFNLGDFDLEVDVRQVSDGGIWLHIDDQAQNGVLLVTGGSGHTGTGMYWHTAVSYTHLRAHETPEHLVCRLLLEKKKK